LDAYSSSPMTLRRSVIIPGQYPQPVPVNWVRRTLREKDVLSGSESSGSAGTGKSIAVTVTMSVWDVP